MPITSNMLDITNLELMLFFPPPNIQQPLQQIPKQTTCHNVGSNSVYFVATGGLFTAQKIS